MIETDVADHEHERNCRREYTIAALLAAILREVVLIVVIYRVFGNVCRCLYTD